MPSAVIIGKIIQSKPNSTNPQIRVQFENQALQIRARTLQVARIRIRAHSKQTLSRQICTMADSATRTTSSAIDDAAIHGLKVIFGLILKFSSAYQASETETLKHDTIRIFLNFRCQTSFCRIPLIQNLSVLAHKPMKTP